MNQKKTYHSPDNATASSGPSFVIVVMSWAAVMSCVVNVVVERERELTWRCVTNAFFLACGAHVTKWSVRSPRVYKPLLFRCFKPHF